MFHRYRTVLLLAAVIAVVLLAYSNHFGNTFHFDDFHTITQNVFIRDLRNIPRFFTNARLFSTMPDHATWRPLISVSLAIDYRLAHGLHPFWFHASSFFWFAGQLVLMFFLFRRIMDLTLPPVHRDPAKDRAPAQDGGPAQNRDRDGVTANTWTALAATACYGLHPACAETVNYIIQRGDLYSTLGVVASLLCFIAWPAQRKYGWYLLPAFAAFLSKAPALIFPFILLAYVLLFERRWRPAIPAFLATIAGAILTAVMTPASYNPGITSAPLYRLTQPLIALHYFRSFFLPTALSADTDWVYVASPFEPLALLGYLFIAMLLAAGWWTARRGQTRPIAFGIAWFILAMLPTSLLPLAEVTNDHRMFFPFVGLTLSVFWSLRLLLSRASRTWWRVAIAGFALVLAAEAAGTYRRNIVWHTEASLWRDVTIKSPRNGRGWMNYGITFIDRNDPLRAIPILEHAIALQPGYYMNYMNMGVAYDHMNRQAEAENYFRRACALAGNQTQPYDTYGAWLSEHSRFAEARQQAEIALKMDPLDINARTVFMDTATVQEDWAALDPFVDETLRIDPTNFVARRCLADRGIRQRMTPEALLDLSAGNCKVGAYQACIAEAKRAIKLRPNYAEAYNNMAAAYFSLEQWDDGLNAVRKAIELKPDYQAARDNLNWALAHRRPARKK